MKKKIYLIAILLIPWLWGLSQTNSNSLKSSFVISGKLSTNSVSPASFVILTKKEEKHPIATLTNVDENGHFILYGIKKGDYILCISGMGCVPMDIPITATVPTKNTYPILLNEISLTDFDELPR